MGAIVMLTDAVCMGMLALSAGMFRWSTTADRIDIVVMVTQQLCVAVLVVPLYMDTLLSLRGTIRNRKPRLKTRESASQRAEREFINRRALRLWGKTWFRMVGSNLFACLRDTREGIRDPTGSRRQARLRAGQIGPYPEWSFKLRAPVPIDLPRRNSGSRTEVGGGKEGLWRVIILCVAPATLFIRPSPPSVWKQPVKRRRRGTRITTALTNVTGRMEVG
ncbi:unnamed protein product, partial [Ectocarpus fasciculatus]